MMPPLLISLILALTPYSGSWETEPVRVTVEVANTEISVADQFEITVSVTVPKLPFDQVLEKARDRNYRTQPPADQLARLPNMALLQIQMDSSQNASSVTDSWTFTLEPQLPGELEIPALTITCDPAEEGDTPIQVVTEPIPIVVRSVIATPGNATLKEAAPKIETSAGPWKWLLLALAVLIWAVLRFGLYRRRLYQGKFYNPARARNPSEYALDELERAEDAQSIHRMLRMVMRSAFDMDISKMPEPTLMESKALSQEAEIELVEILRQLESAIYAKETEKVSPELKARVREFLKSHLPS